MTDFNATVLIPTHNRPHSLPRCIDSILRQCLPPRQILVVDDGSTNETREVLAPYLDRLEYCWQANAGKSAAVNQALPRVRGDFLWIFDDDDVALPTALESHARAFARAPEAGFSYSSFYNGKDNGAGDLDIVSAQPIPHIPEEKVFVELLFGNFTKGQPATVVRTRCYREIGPFDETLLRSQDYEILLRLCRRFRGVGVEEFTFIKQMDNQVITPASSVPGNASRAILWQEADREIVQRLHAQLRPIDYVPERARTDRLTDAEERLFRLRRMTMMARRDIWDAALADLRAFAASLANADYARLCDEERRLLERATAPRYGGSPNPNSGQIAALRRIVAGDRTGALGTGLRSGLLASAKAALARRRAGPAARALLLAARLGI